MTPIRIFDISLVWTSARRWDVINVKNGRTIFAFKGCEECGNNKFPDCEVVNYVFEKLDRKQINQYKVTVEKTNKRSKV